MRQTTWKRADGSTGNLEPERAVVMAGRWKRIRRRAQREKRARARAAVETPERPARRYSLHTATEARWGTMVELEAVVRGQTPGAVAWCVIDHGGPVPELVEWSCTDGLRLGARVLNQWVEVVTVELLLVNVSGGERDGERLEVRGRVSVPRGASWDVRHDVAWDRVTEDESVWRVARMLLPAGDGETVPTSVVD